jgi:hypothetical protein
MEYFAHSEESAVFRVDENDNGEWTPCKLWDCAAARLIGEYPISKKGDVFLGNPDYMSIPIEISKQEYDTFGVTWIFGKECGSKFTKVAI